MATKQTQLQAIPFATFARTIVNAHKASDKANAKMRDTVQVAMQQFIDANAQANGRTEDSCKALQKAIKESEVANNSVALGIMEAKTWTEYAQSAARALYWNKDFAPSLKNDADLALPWSKKAKSNPATTAGRTVNTNRAELDKTLSKALKQMRMISLEGTAADLLDFLTERLADFKEIEASK